MKWRMGPVARNRLVLLALFGLAFGSVLVYVNVARGLRVDTQGTSDALRPAHRKPKLAGSATTTAVAPQTSAGSAIASTATQQSLDGSSSAPTDPLPSSMDSDADLDARTDSAHVELHSSSDEFEPADTAPSFNASPETVRTLVETVAETLTTDPDTHRRVRAITELSDLAARGYEVSAVRDTLRLASADDDADVAERARDAYDDLVQRLD